MIFKETSLSGAYIIELDKRIDERGFFSRFFCVNEYGALNLDNKIHQINISFSKHKGTLRGMHYQLPPMAETKIVSCIKGALYDVILDLRKNSPTFGKHFGEELSEENGKMMCVPKGFAHGFLTLKENTEALYLVTEFYSPELERGIRWNDPLFNIKWPFNPDIISEKDKNQEAFNTEKHLWY
jgi:dTDP-4-dehydrorhamnose 3,5-epimerase